MVGNTKAYRSKFMAFTLYLAMGLRGNAGFVITITRKLKNLILQCNQDRLRCSEFLIPSTLSYTSIQELLQLTNRTINFSAPSCLALPCQENNSTKKGLRRLSSPSPHAVHPTTTVITRFSLVRQAMCTAQPAFINNRHILQGLREHHICSLSGSTCCR
jgi:hypothetical protein